MLLDSLRSGNENRPLVGEGQQYAGLGPTLHRSSNEHLPFARLRETHPRGQPIDMDLAGLGGGPFGMWRWPAGCPLLFLFFLLLDLLLFFLLLDLLLFFLLLDLLLFLLLFDPPRALPKVCRC